ncbi:MAG TPA: hypothetical protein DCZ91_06405 [Lachnospiraceae bacterium]|nr:hypothetical protein [Lachnospiraceae bacterium]
MERYLNWTFDYRRHQGAGCDFYGRVTELLARENRDGGRWREFSVLPNFGFNHQGLEDGKTDTAVGSLWIERQLEQSEWIYKVRREGGTSGEKLEL